jgi:outer membrane immunogenic protein
MKQVIARFLALTALISVPAFAADMPMKAAPPAAATYTWTGWYVGANAGYGGGDPRSNTTLSGLGTGAGGVLTTPATVSHSDPFKFSGAVGGFQAGYNWQAWNRWIAGVEADWQATSENASLHYLDPYGFIMLPLGPGAGAAATDYKASILWFGTVRGRVGYAWDDRFFLYATSGLAYGRARLSGTVNDSGTAGLIPPFVVAYNGTSSFNVAQTRVGWTIGGGIEGALINNWTWKAEYLYVDLGAMNATVAGPFTGETVALHARLTDNIVRAGVNLRLGP